MTSSLDPRLEWLIRIREEAISYEKNGKQFWNRYCLRCKTKLLILTPLNCVEALANYCAECIPKLIAEKLLEGSGDAED